jgi:hypothetical protein
MASDAAALLASREENCEMKRPMMMSTIRVMIHSLLLALLLAPALGGCSKAKEEDCKQAVANIRRLYGTHAFSQEVTPQAMIRSCRGSASPEAVKCFIAAQSKEDLSKCEGSAGAMAGGGQGEPAGEGQ